jgi:hypothetical protein
MTRFLIAGTHENDPVVLEFRRAAGRKALRTRRITLGQAAIVPGPDDWVLVCFVPGASPIREILVRLNENRARTIVYARRKELDPSAAIEFCVMYNVRWVFSQEEEHTQRRDLKRRMRRVLSGERPVKKIPVAASDLRSAGGFVISRFAEEFREQNAPAIEAVGEHLALRFVYGDFQHTSGSLPDKIRRHIDECGAVVGDISQTGPGDLNPNVIYEIAHAKARGKYVILVFDERRGCVELPTDLQQGDELLGYWGPMDLGVVLYFGLKEGLAEPNP